MSVPLILASSSRSRRDVLYHAGICAMVRPPHVDEPQTVHRAASRLGMAAGAVPAEQRVMVLAQAKAHAVFRSFRELARTASAARGELQVSRPLKDGCGVISSVEPIQQAISRHEGIGGAQAGPLVIGCDSMFAFGGGVYGKPHDADHAKRRLRAVRGHAGTLWTGHCLIDGATGHEARAISHAEVTFGNLSDQEIDSYVATREPLEVAGAFTLEGFGSAFIEAIRGDPSGVMGISMPTLRSLAAQLGFQWPDLWNLTAEATRKSGPDSLHAPADNVHQPGDGWVNCACGQRHWGLNGAAGVLLARRDAAGGITHVLLQHRALWSMEGGTWGVPGGAMADGESPLEGALRESFEEANIRPGDVNVVGSYKEDHGPWSYTTVFAFEKPGHTVEPQPNDDESLAVEWVPLAKVGRLTLISPLQRNWTAFVARLKQIARLEAAGSPR